MNSMTDGCRGLDCREETPTPSCIGIFRSVADATAAYGLPALLAGGPQIATGISEGIRGFRGRM